MQKSSRTNNHFEPAKFNDKMSSSSHTLKSSHVKDATTRDQFGLSPKYQEYLMNLPQCPYHHKPIKYLCVNPKCAASNYGLCAEEQCKNHHESPVIDLIELSKFNEVIITNTSSLISVAERVKTYLKAVREKLVHKIDVDIEKSQYLLESYHLNSVIQLIKEKKFRENRQRSTTSLSKQIDHLNQSNSKKQNGSFEAFSHSTSRKYRKIIQYEQMLLLDLFKGNLDTIGDYVNGLNLANFNSNILTFKEQFQSLCKMMKQNRAPIFKQFSLVYRASEHNYSASQYHKYSDNKSPLLILIKTQKNKKFGAFLNCKINNQNDWICDATGLSFIFSLDHNQSYRLKSQANSRVKTAFGGTEGPQIGMGCDIYIVDKCNLSKKNGSNFGGSYRLPNNLQFSSMRARSYLAGEQFFLVAQYEVFHLI